MSNIESIVESLEVQKRCPVHSTNHISLLENIAIFTYETEVPLLDIFKIIFKSTEGKITINHKKDGKTLSSYFSEILPDYDEERVYVSNIKKVIQWYNILVNAGFDFSKIEASTVNSDTM